MVALGVLAGGILGTFLQLGATQNSYGHQITQLQQQVRSLDSRLSPYYLCCGYCLYHVPLAVELDQPG